jgi:hypothetical protein
MTVKKQGGRDMIGLKWLTIWNSGHGDEPDDSKRPEGAEFVYHVRKY